MVYATVLPWGGSKWGGTESAGGAAFEAALGAYVSDWKKIRSAFPNALRVVAGDFNQDLEPYHYYGSIKQRKLLKSSLAAAGVIALTSEANDPKNWEPSKRHACIDHICVSESIGIRVGSTIRWPDSGKPDPRLSDHFGVAVELLRG